MSQKTSTSPHSTDVAKQPYCTYHGIHTDSRFRIIRNGKKALVFGAAWELEAKPLVNGKQQKWSRNFVGDTPGYMPCAEFDKSIIAHCPETGKRYRIIGRVEYGTSKNVIPKSPFIKAKCPTLDAPANTSAKKPVGQEKLKSNTNEAFIRELESIAALCAAGHDPDVRMSFIAPYVGESKPNLYRKMGTTFPKPVKRGKGSFWPMSLIEAYKSGKLLEQK